MALSTIGNVTYINQNSQLGSIQHANNMQKVDFALHANMQEFVDKLKTVQEVSPTPQTKEVDPDGKRENGQDFEQNKEQDRQDSDKEYSSKENTHIDTTHLLDIKA